METKTDSAPGSAHRDISLIRGGPFYRAQVATRLIGEDQWNVGRRITFAIAVGDVMLGPTHVDGRPFFVRQMKNMKASIPVEWLTGASFNYYAQGCAALLSRAHGRAGDAAAISGYCGKSPMLDEALVAWAEAYGDQTERDHARLVQAIKSGRVKAIEGV